MKIEICLAVNVGLSHDLKQFLQDFLEFKLMTLQEAIDKLTVQSQAVSDGVQQLIAKGTSGGGTGVTPEQQTALETVGTQLESTKTAIDAALATVPAPAPAV